MLAVLGLHALTSHSTPATAGQQIQGDADCDTDVDAVDGLEVLKFAAAIGPFADCLQPAGDVNCDGAIGATDTLGILRFLAAFPALPVPAGCIAVGETFGEPTPGSGTPPVSNTAPATPTPTPTPGGGGSPSPTFTPTATPELSPSGSATLTPTPTVTPTPTPTPPDTGSPTITPTPTPTPTPPATPIPYGYVLGDPLDNVDIDNMTDLAVDPSAPDEAIVVTLDGRIYRISLTDAFVPEELADISGMMGPITQDEGLVSVAFEPGQPGWLYVNYTTGDHEAYYRPNETPAPTVPANPKRNVISRFPLAGDTLNLAGEEIVIEVLQPGFWHNVNEIIFDDNGYLYAGAGDGGGTNAQYDADGGQGATNLLATIFRIDPNPPGTPGYAVPPDNPFVGEGGADEVWATGFRNPWRISFDNGTLWTGDVGEFYWEEINEVLPGMNYGWEVLEGPHGDPLGYYCHGSHELDDCAALANSPGYKQPRTAYCHYFVYQCPYDNPVEQDTAVIGGYVYRGDDLPELNGWYVYGDLGSVRLRAFDTSDDDSEPIVLAEKDTMVPQDQACTNCLRSFAQLPNGEILAVIAPWGAPGGIYRLIRAPDPTPAPSPTSTATATPTPTVTPTPTQTP